MKYIIPYNYVRVSSNGFQYSYDGVSLEELYLQYGFGYTGHAYRYFISTHWISIL